MGSDLLKEFADNLNSEANVLSLRTVRSDKKTLIAKNLLQSGDSTLSFAEADELATKLSKVKSHNDELKAFKEVGSKTPIVASHVGTDPNYKFTIVWFNLIGFIVLHIIGVAGTIAAHFSPCVTLLTLYSFFVGYTSALGVTMGAHRLWTHRSFKAKRWLKILLLYLFTLSGQNCLWVWVRDHRQHHKYSDTDADPHNVNRGFWFSHIGWLCVRKHPKVFEYGKKIDMTDIEADPYIMFQKKYYKTLYIIFAITLPTVIPIFAWNENPLIALGATYFARTIYSLNFTWLVNSAAHLYGTRPYDETLFPVESMFVSALVGGEGWHNYHHAFPWDYRAAELGSPCNFTGVLIDFLAKFGAIYDRKEATAIMVKNRCLRTGDKTHAKHGVPEQAPSTKTFLKTWKHPLNPSYTTTQVPKVKMLTTHGYALTEAELSKSNLDGEIFS